MFHESSAYLSLPRAAEAWIVKDLLPVGGSLNLYGPPKAGKSIASLQLASAIADDRSHDWLSFPILTHGRVCYLQVDTPRALWMQHIDGLCEEGLSFDNVFFADRETAPYPFDIFGEGGEKLETYLSELGPVAIFVDTIREIHALDENDSKVMKNVVSALVACTLPAAVVIISHSRKENPLTGPDLMSDGRGSSYLAGRMDGVASLTKARSGADHRSLTFQSRTHEETTLTLNQLKHRHGLLELADAFLVEASALKAQHPDVPLAALATQLNRRYPSRSVESIRSALRRL